MAEVSITILSKFVDKGLKEAERGFGSLTSSPAFKAIGGAAVALGATAAAGFAAAGAAALDFGNQTTKAMDALQQQTGATTDELEQFKGLALDVFAQNWGDSIEDVAGVMAEVRNQTGLTGQALKDVTQNALVLRDRFGKDVKESVDSATVLMDEFGLSSEQAFDFIVTGIQNGLDRNDDFLDSIREYGNLFNDAGFSADEFFSIMETGAEGGVLGTDKIADAFKEFQIRFLEGSDAVKGAIQELTGDDWEMFITEIQAGDSTVSEVMQNIIGSLQQLEDPLERNRLQVALFGTQAEDLGASFTENLSTATTSIDDMAGAIAQASANSTDLGAMWEQVIRSFQVGIEPVAAELLPFLGEAIAAVSEFLIEAQPTFAEFASNLRDTIGPASVIIADALERTGVALGIVDEGASATDVSMELLSISLQLVVTGLKSIAVIAHVIADMAEFTRRLNDQWQSLINNLSEALALIDRFGIIGSGIKMGTQGGAFGSGFGGFQHGGAFTVGGVGGPDSQLVMFRASPGETVQVTPRGQVDIGNLSVSGLNSGAVAEAVRSTVSRAVNDALGQFQRDLINEVSR